MTDMRLNVDAKPLLYSDDINGAMICRDDQWQVSTGALNAVADRIEAYADSTRRLEQENAELRLEAHYAEQLAVELECVLLDGYAGKWWDGAMGVLAKYRDAVRATGEAC